jgi:DNA-binding MarR family transcriptional regulator
MQNSLSITLQKNHARSLKNNNYVRSTGGHLKGSLADLAVNSSERLFLVYLYDKARIQKQSSNTDCIDVLYTYDIKVKSDWEDLHIDKDKYTKMLNKLEKAGWITNISTNKRKHITYQLPPRVLVEDIVLPLVFVRSLRLSWATKVKIYNLILLFQAEGLEEVKFTPTKDKSMHPVLKQSKESLTTLINELDAREYIDKIDGVYTLNLERVLSNVVTDLTYDLAALRLRDQRDNIFLKKKCAKLERENKRLSQSIYPIPRKRLEDL